tara:strand:+ start:242 stop:493 length:252 start_codon:yes stop_codon:yes gene_type:complete
MEANKPDTKKNKRNSSQDKSFSTSDEQDVLVNLPGGLKYKMPGKRQRVVIGSIVIGLNILLVLSVVIYFYSPPFQQFVYNFGR